MRPGDLPPLRLGVNIDHVATLRNARGTFYPDPVRAAQMALEAGADGITAHLREDRRHIVDEDVERLKADVALPLNLEMAATREMTEIALRVRPNACCIVPERREEVTTEGGLDARGQHNSLKPIVAELRAAGIKVSLFIDPIKAQVDAAADLGATTIELHTGTYCHLIDDGEALKVEAELVSLRKAAAEAAALGLEVHAGHGLTFDNVAPIAAIPELAELNIGHFLVSEALFSGLDSAVSRMREIMNQARCSP